MIKGYCVTNLDEYKQELWPELFVAVPREGEWVKAQSGKVLTVVKVTHEMEKIFEDCECARNARWEPRIRVELHK